MIECKWQETERDAAAALTDLPVRAACVPLDKPKAQLAWCHLPPSVEVVVGITLHPLFILRRRGAFNEQSSFFSYGCWIVTVAVLGEPSE